MIVDYYRPKNIQETVNLLDNQELDTILMGGGTAIDRFKTNPMAVIDLQDVGLGKIHQKGNMLEIGATATLQSLYDDLQGMDALQRSILQEATHNLRQVGTVAGTLIASSGRSPFATTMLALDPMVSLQPGNSAVTLGDLLLMKEVHLKSKLVTKLTIPTNVKLAYEQVGRTPADLPIVCASLAVWPGGRTRLVLGGHGTSPALISDGPERGGEADAAKDAFSTADDERASASYRQAVAQILVNRCFTQIEEME